MNECTKSNILKHTVTAKMNDIFELALKILIAKFKI